MYVGKVRDRCRWSKKHVRSGIFLEKLLRGGKIEIFVSKGGHACVRVHALIVCVPVLIINVCVPA